jgi:hypothetical protein
MPTVAGVPPGIATPLVTAAGAPSPSPVVSAPKDATAVADIQLETVPLEPRSIPASYEPGGGIASAPADEPAAAPATPMLDAANRRIAAVTRQQRESREETAPAPAAPGDRIMKLASRAQSRDGQPPGGPVLDPARTDPRSPKGERAGTKSSASPEKPTVPTATEAPPPVATSPKGSQKENEKRPGCSEQKDGPAATPSAARAQNPCAPEDRDPLRITELRLCRKVSGFGAFEPLSESSVKAGQPVLIYCEMTGLRYEAKVDGFVSRVSSHIEIRACGGGPIRWERDLGAGEDVCRRRRHDYYVNYLVELPETLSPGAYELRLTQTDQVANRSATAQIPLLITPR